MERILVVTVNWLGDALMTTPVFEAIKLKFPEAYLGVMAPERVTDVFTDNPFIDRVIIFDEKKNQKGLFAKLNFIRSLKKEKFDTVFLIHRSFTKALICWLAGIKSRIGYRRFKSLFILTSPVSPPKNILHRQDYYLSLFENQGISFNEKTPVFYISGQIQQKVNVSFQAIRQKHKYIVGMNPSANWEAKRWPAENFAELADHLIKKHQAAVLFIGTKKERQLIAQVTKQMKFQAYDFSAKTNLKELGALMKNSDLFVSNDSGPAHLAAALAVPTLVLFGPTAREITAPRGPKVKIIQKDFGCRIPCYDFNCRDNKCMKDITPQEVIVAAENQMANV